MCQYFECLTNNNAHVLHQQLKLKISKLKVDWSFQWFQYIKDHSDKPWDYDSMCANPNVTWELIQAYPQLFRDFKLMCSNPNISWELIQTFPESDENYDYASMNPNITLDIVHQYPD